MHTIKDVLTKEDLDVLYSDSAFTFEGLDIRHDSIVSFLDHMKELEVIEDKSIDIFVTKGKLMNEMYGLNSTNKYPDDLNIVSVKLNSFTNISKLAIIKMDVDARWFNDIVDNNKRRSEEL